MVLASEVALPVGGLVLVVAPPTGGLALGGGGLCGGSSRGMLGVQTDE